MSVSPAPSRTDETDLAAYESSNWLRPGPTHKDFRFDVILAVALSFSALVSALLYLRTGIFRDVAAPWTWVIALSLGTLPLAYRRRYPSLAAVGVTIGFFVGGQFGVPDLLVLNVCLFIALYSIGAWEQNRRLAFWTRFGLSVAVLLWLILSLIVSSSDTSAYPGISRSGLFSAYATFAVIQIITNLAYFTGAFPFGERSWQSARTHAALEQQSLELVHERRTSAAQAVALERINIARELHDVVAHHVSVMGLHAAGAHRLINTDAAAAAAALEVVESEAETTITELRRLLHTLRTPDSEGIPSTLGVAQFAELVEVSRSTGVPTTLIVAGEPHELPLLVDVAFYRIVQEALTNVRKHAGRGATATVRLRYGSANTEVEVSDTGVRTTLARPSEVAGLGLRGMRERIAAVGGTLVAARREHGGFLVRATVPNETSAERTAA